MRSAVTGSSPGSSPRTQRQETPVKRDASSSLSASNAAWNMPSSPPYQMEMPNMPVAFLDSGNLDSNVDNEKKLGEPFDMGYDHSHISRASEAGTIKMLQAELDCAMQRIVELEAQVKIWRSDTGDTDLRNEERRKMNANLEVQTTVVKTGNEVSQDQDEANAQAVFAKFTQEMQATKSKLQDEIQKLITQRDELLDENARLVKLREVTSLETQSLTSKNQQFMDLNSELTRQIQNESRKKASTHSPAPSESTVFSNRSLRHRNEGSADYSPSMTSFKAPLFSRHNKTAETKAIAHPSHDTRDSVTATLVDEPALIEETAQVDEPAKIGASSASSINGSTMTIGESVMSNEISTVNSSGSGSTTSSAKFWKKRGPAAVAKGFNKVFTVENALMLANFGGEFATNLDGPTSKSNEKSAYLRKESTDHGQQQQSPGGLGISMSKSASARSGISSLAGSEHSKQSTASKLRGMKLKVSADRGNSEDMESTLFSMDISQRAAFERREVPLIVMCCIREVELRGMDYEGIYRKSGIKSQITAIQELFERAPSELWESSESSLLSESGSALFSNLNYDKSPAPLSRKMAKWQEELTEAMAQDICGVTSVLKQYLRYIPNPIITFESYLDFVNLTDIVDVEGRIYSMTQIVKSLPFTHQRCLEVLMRHLSRVVEFSDKNLVCFSPHIVVQLCVCLSANEYYSDDIEKSGGGVCADACSRFLWIARDYGCEQEGRDRTIYD